jgi:hypothetical protein
LLVWNLLACGREFFPGSLIIGIIGIIVIIIIVIIIVIIIIQIQPSRRSEKKNIGGMV